MTDEVKMHFHSYVGSETFYLAITVAAKVRIYITLIVLCLARYDYLFADILYRHRPGFCLLFQTKSSL